MTSRHPARTLWALLMVLTLLLAACSTADDGDEETTDAAADDTAAEDEPADDEPAGDESADAEPADDAAADDEPAEEEPADDGGDDLLAQTDFFVQEDFEAQLALADATPEGPDDQPWLQQLDPTMVETTDFAVDGEGEVCFSNISEGNGWRAQGATTAQAAAEDIENVTLNYVDAEGDDNQQIADIEALVDGGTCDVLIVAPFTADALTPAVELACDAGLPVVVLASPVNSDCQTTYVSSIGGYLFGYQGAEFIVENAEPGANVLALRILPGVAELEWRWGAAVEAFRDSDVNVVAVEFTEQDPTATKQIVTDAIQRFGQIDAVWMDAGAAAIPTIEAFEDAGLEVPLIVGEDENQFLQAWAEGDLNAVAPTFPNYQWRTAIEAAADILEGTPVPERWIVPQPAIQTAEERDEAIAEELGPLFYALCGCRDLGSFPDAYS
ncbi:substrate-binding domain-containing protein [Euzebya tangerina]|uniref:substrate-binding domain-containing protein n=1 Tax=Euzebya tangerina TaxID=591198 RepID=UPI000E317455|nr:substrate-binding domain-containing protein [Euzebya tangerina]